MKKTRFLKQQIGLTLIELLIYMGLLTILLAVLSGVFSSIISTTLESKSTSSVEQDSRYIFLRLVYDIHRASAIVTPASLGAQGETLQLTINGSLYTYTLTNNNLELTSNSGTDQINSIDTKISAINFQRIGKVNGKNTIVMSYTIESSAQKSSGQKEIKTVQTTVGIR